MERKRVAYEGGAKKKQHRKPRRSIRNKISIWAITPIVGEFLSAELSLTSDFREMVRWPSGSMAKAKDIITVEHLESRIYEIRGLRIMLGSDLAKLYGVEAKYLVRAFKRNIDRFPDDFAFQLSNQEVTDLKCQIGTSSSWGGRRTRPYAFTEHGAIMAATVLNSRVAIEMSVHVVRAFVRARRYIEQHKDLAHELKELKHQLGAKFSDYDKQFRIVFKAIDQLITPLTERKHRRIGFKGDL